MAEETASKPLNFIQQAIEEDIRSGRVKRHVHTRFPPEPNGYLHIGHAKSINLNYGLAQQYQGKFNLRFDDTNPVKEEQEFVDSIVEDVRWLGARWEGIRDDDPMAGVLFSSDYFETMYQHAVTLIQKGLAYVDDQNAEQIRESRGTLKTPGKESPYRDRSVEENLDLFARMRQGEFANGQKVLRAKIDMSSPNLNLRDPVMYRILHAHHHRAKGDWCVYPMYDWAHGLEDSIEGITHSLCTLEFENHRPLYDWFLQQLDVYHPRQIEFARLSVTYMMTSKRKLRELVEERHVSGWDDPRMPTISGLRRRGYTAEALRDFCTQVGIAKYDGVNEIQLLEHCLRDDLNKRAPRVMAVLRPIKLVIENWGDGGDENRVDWLEAVNLPDDPAAGARQVPFTRELYIERDDFMEDPPKKFFRLGPGREVRLRYGYFVTCTGFEKDPATGEVTEIRCTYDPATRGGDAPDGRKVKGTIHWVSASEGRACTVRLYDYLFTKPDADALTPEQEAAGLDYRANLNPDSLEALDNCWIEPKWRDAANAGTWSDTIPRVQFERLGYFCEDKDSTSESPVFNRTVTLRDSWSKAVGA
ncbi:MAG: glutamine--tRNA ligase/YqeY domain fusion protein [Phycisphaerae bacterium]